MSPIQQRAYDILANAENAMVTLAEIDNLMLILHHYTADNNSAFTRECVHSMVCVLWELIEKAHQDSKATHALLTGGDL